MSPDPQPPTPPRWTFGVEPLAQAVELAPLVRRVVGLVHALEGPHPAVEHLIAELRHAEQALVAAAPVDTAPRVGVDAPSERRPYVDHSRDIGAFNPAFPEYEIEVLGARAIGSVTFPIAFEGPPGIVHGGVQATFFDSAIQHHNCDLGVAGKTTSLLVRYRRPVPLAVPLRFEIERGVDDRRITSTAQLLLGDELLSSATVDAVLGNLANLPPVSPRRPA
jgi:hypothetical protein